MSEPARDPAMQITRIVSRLRDIELWLRDERRLDPEMAQRLHDDMQKVHGTIGNWPPRAPGGDYYRGPDDAGFKPSSADAMLTGPARVTGATARAVKRGKTYTRAQLRGEP